MCWRRQARQSAVCTPDVAGLTCRLFPRHQEQTWLPTGMTQQSKATSAMSWPSQKCRLTLPSQWRPHFYHVCSISTTSFFSRNRLIWLVQQLRTIIHKSQPNSLITLMFRSHHETFVRRSCHIKKTIVGMTQLTAISYQLTADRHITIRKNWIPASSDEGLAMRPKRQGN